MRPRPFLLLGWAAAVALALFWAERSVESLRQRRLQLAALGLRAVDLDHAVRAAEHRLAEARRAEQAAAQDAGGQAQETGRNGSAQNSKRNARTKARLDELERKSARSNDKIKYQPLIRALRLTSEQADRLLDALVARQMRDEAASSDPARNELLKQSVAQLEASLPAVLGVEGTRQFYEFVRTENVRNLVDDAAGRAAAESVPYTTAQATTLTQLLTSLSPSHQQEIGISVGSIDWDSALAQAAGVLSAPQINALKGALAADQAKGTLFNLMRLAADSQPFGP